jgi:ribosomal protein S18 acetylase RimI-like enzyme
MAIFDREYDLHIIEIYVREESRQRGVASTLLSEVEAWEPAQDCEYATLVVHVDNQAAHSHYEKHEFEETRTFYAKPLR